MFVFRGLGGSRVSEIWKEQHLFGLKTRGCFLQFVFWECWCWKSWPCTPAKYEGSPAHVPIFQFRMGNSGVQADSCGAIYGIMLHNGSRLLILSYIQDSTFQATIPTMGPWIFLFFNRRKHELFIIFLREGHIGFTVLVHEFSIPSPANQSILSRELFYACLLMVHPTLIDD
jgi:hypothetical protein